MINAISLVNIHYLLYVQLFSCDKNLTIDSLNFQICNIVLLTIVTMLFLTSPKLICLFMRYGLLDL